jgi:hypothetical protein
MGLFGFVPDEPETPGLPVVGGGRAPGGLDQPRQGIALYPVGKEAADRLAPADRRADQVRGIPMGMV